MHKAKAQTSYFPKQAATYAETSLTIPEVYIPYRRVLH